MSPTTRTRGRLRRAGIAVALAAALVLAGALLAQAAVLPGTGPTTGGSTVQVDVVGAGFTKVFGGPAAGQTYGLTDDNTLYAWVDNFGGQLGNGAGTARSTPTNVTATGALAGKTIVQQVASANATVYALARDGSLFAWGYSTTGELGTGSTTRSYTPVAVSVAGQPVSQIAAGTYGALTLTTGGVL